MEAIPQPTCCETCCDDRIETAVPGPTGAAGSAGADGADGDDGVSPWTLTTADFVMPAEGATVAVSVLSNLWAFVGQIVQVEVAGYMEVTVVPGITTSVTLKNIEDTAAGTYPNNVAPGTVVADPVKIVPTGPTGPAGAATGAPGNASYVCRTANGTLSNETDLSALVTGYVKSQTGTGNVTTVAAIPIIDLDTGIIPAGTVLTADGLGSCVAQPVADDMIEWEVSVLVSGAAANVNWALGRYFRMALPAGPGITTLTHINTVPGKSITVSLLQHAATARSVDWVGVDRWPGGAEMEMTTTLGAKAIYSFTDDGLDVTGTVINNCS